MLQVEQVALHSEINTKHIKYGQNVQFMNAKPVGASGQDSLATYPVFYYDCIVFILFTSVH